MALKGIDRQTHPTPEVETGGPPGNGGIDIIAWIYEIMAWIVATFNAVLQWVANLFNWLIGILVSIFHFLLKFLKHIWENYVKAAIVWLYKHAMKLRAWLKRVITPILKRLEKIKKWYDEHILKQQLRMLQFLQTIRRFLGILRLFHVKWAAALDQDLADIQNRIEESIRIVRGVLNEIINTLAMVLDPTLLLKTNVLAGSLLGNLAAVKRIFGFAWHGPLTADETTFLDHNVGRYNKDTAGNHIASLTSTGLTDYDQSERTDCRKGISDAIGGPLPF
jgi:ABC-type proline/glycine betaine transport system permease subunit